MPSSKSNNELTIAKNANVPLHASVTNTASQVEAAKVALRDVEVVATKIHNKSNIDLIAHSKDNTDDVAKVITAKGLTDTEVTNYQTNLVTKTAALKSQAEAANTSTQDVLTAISDFGRDYIKDASAIKTRVDLARAATVSQQGAVNNFMSDVDIHDKNISSAVSNISKPMTQTVSEKTAGMALADSAMTNVAGGLASNTNKPNIIGTQEAETDALRLAYDSKKTEIETTKAGEIANIQGMNDDPEQEAEYAGKKTALMTRTSSYSTPPAVAATQAKQTNLGTANSNCSSKVAADLARLQSHLLG